MKQKNLIFSEVRGRNLSTSQEFIPQEAFNQN